MKAAENVASQVTTNNAANVSFIENTYGVTHANAVRSTIDNADDDVKAVWNKYQNKFKTSNATYTGNRDNGKEIFAEIISAEIASPESLDCIKKYFPETYKVFRDMLKAVK